MSRGLRFRDVIGSLVIFGASCWIFPANIGEIVARQLTSAHQSLEE